jgi:hypothetical protein
MEWLTATDSSDPEPGTLDGTVDLDCLIGVPGTTWMEPALRTEKRGYQALVSTDDTEE